MEESMWLFFKVLLLAHIVRSANIIGRVDPLVLTEQGLVKGVRSADGDYSSFLGIPYAQINTSFPFGASMPAPIFEDIYQAYDGSIACPQTNMYSSDSLEIGTLDCLRLNIYVPNEANSKNPLPVLVWIHGGGYGQGKAGDYAPSILVRHNIVLVTINYRLGPYGFMCLNTPSIPGNQGLKDQLSALRWIKHNIAAFGGNPYKITLAGEGAGSGSVNLHLYSSHEKLFHQAILQSGIASSQLVQNDELAAVKLADHLGFHSDNIESAIEFLSNTPVELVTAATAELNIKFSPCIENSESDHEIFISSNPFSATFPRKTNNVPIIIGVTSRERYGSLNTDETSSFKDIIKSRFDFEQEELENVLEIIEHFYVGDVLDNSHIATDLEDIEADITDNHPTEREITKLYEQGAGPVYSYVFEYVSENDEGDRVTSSAPHMAELKYLFSDGNFNEEEQKISDRISKLWTNFVKDGNPTKGLNATMTWPAISGDERPYVAIGTRLRVEHRFRHANVAFWDLFYEKYGAAANIFKYGFTTSLK